MHIYTDFHDGVWFAYGQEDDDESPELSAQGLTESEAIDKLLVSLRGFGT